MEGSLNGSFFFCFKFGETFKLISIDIAMFDIHKDTKVSNTVNNFQKGSYASQHTTGTLEGKKKDTLGYP